MADRYWVGGSGTWNTSSTTNWSTSSGGASGASAPTASDNVFFDSNSNVGTGAFTVTVSAAVCNDITIGGASAPQALDGAMTLAMASSTLTVSGSWTNQATNFAVTNTAGTLTFNATTTGKTITTNGVTIGVATTLNGVGGAWTLGSALNISSSYILTLTNGTFNTSASNYAVTAADFTSSNSNTRTINLNGSTITLNIGWSMSTSTNATLNSGTSTIASSSTVFAFAGGGLTYYNLSCTSTTATANIKSITGTNTFNNLTFSTIASAGLNNITIGANQTINGTLTVNGSNGNRRMFVRSDTIGTTRTLTCAAIAAMTDVDFRDITIAGAAGTLSGTRLGDCGGNSNITFVAGTNKYWNLAAGANWNSSNVWATSSGGSVADTNYPLPQDTAIIENTGLNTSATITINGAWNIGTLDSSTRTNTMTFFSSTSTPTFYGNFTYGSGVFPSGTGTYTFSNRSTKTLNSGGKTFTQPITINAPSGGIQLVTNNLTLGSTLATTLTQGTLDLNNLTLTTGTFSSINSNTRTIAFGTGNITCSGTGSVWGNSTVTGFTTTGTQVVNITSTGSTPITVTNGILSEANSISFNFTGGTYPLTFFQISGNTARNVNFTGYAGTLQATGPTTIYGNLTLSTGMSLTASGNAMTFGATSGTQLITTNGKTLDFPVTFDGVGSTFKLQDAMTVGSTRTTTLTNGTLDLNNLTLTTGLFASSNSNTRTIAFGTGNISCSGTGTVWSTATATNLTTTGTQVVNVTSAGSTAITVSSGVLSETNSISFNFTGGTYALTFLGTTNYTARNVNFTGYAGTLAQVIGSIFGNLTFSTGMSLTASNSTWTFGATSGTQQITTNGKTLDFPITFNGVGGTFSLQDAMTLGSTRTMTLTNGTLNLNGNTCTVGTAFTTATGTKNLTFNGGTLVCPTASTTAFNNASPTNFTTTAGTGTGTISMTAATAKTFVGGGSTYNCTLNQGGAGALTITGSNTFDNITNTVQPASVLFTAGTTSTFLSGFSLSGTAGNLITIGSATAASHTLSKASGTVSVSYCSISRSSATGGAIWQALTANGNVDGGNNTGWIFSTGSGNFLMFF